MNQPTPSSKVAHRRLDTHPPMAMRGEGCQLFDEAGSATSHSQAIAHGNEGAVHRLTNAERHLIDRRVMHQLHILGQCCLLPAHGVQQHPCSKRAWNSRIA